MSGLLISFDGLDSTGKATQVRQLIARLELNRHRVHHWQSPDYTTRSGQELKLRLQDKLGNWRTTPWETKMRYFAANRAEHKDEVLAALRAGDIVVYDRYVQSSLAFIACEALVPPPAERAGLAAENTDRFRSQVHETVNLEEYTKNGMPQANVSIFLDVPPRVAATLLTRRKENLRDQDEYTDHLAIQERLYNEYDQLINAQPQHWLRVKCVEGSELLPVEAVSELVWKGLQARFPEL
jgi:dTMP kinase